MTRIARLILLLILLAAPRTLAGQNPELEPEPAPVVVSEKSAFAAGAIEWFVPTGGYAYAGDWSRGIPSGVVRLAGFAMIAEQQFTIWGDPPPCEGTCVAGVILAAGGTLWGVLGAAATARRTNERLRGEALARVSVSPVRGPDGTGVRIGMRLSVGR